MLLCTSSGRSSRRAWKTIPGGNAVLEITVIQATTSSAAGAGGSLEGSSKGILRDLCDRVNLAHLVPCSLYVPRRPLASPNPAETAQLFTIPRLFGKTTMILPQRLHPELGLAIVLLLRACAELSPRKAPASLSAGEGGVGNSLFYCHSKK